MTRKMDGLPLLKWREGCLLIMTLLLTALPAEPGLPYKPKKVRCRSVNYPWCHLLWQYCPPQCPVSCVVDCASCKPVCSCNYPGSICQDPRFVGGDGVAFYFHGEKGQDFCLFSDKNLHINAHFIGKRLANMTRDFTWVQSVAILFDYDQIYVAAKNTSSWDGNIDHLTIAFNGKFISLPTKENAVWRAPSPTNEVTFTRVGETNGISVEVKGRFKMTAIVVPITAQESTAHGYNITGDNCFAHLELGFKFYKLSEDVDGVLGQTYRKNYVTKVKMGMPMPVMGGNDKFSSSNLFSTDCAVSQFVGYPLAEGKIVAESASMQCGSKVAGMQGLGVVCKK